MNSNEIRNLADDIVKILDSKKAFNIKLLGIEKQTVIADYFVLACGANNTQVSALADELEFKLSENGVNADRREGHGASEWIVLDYNSVIVHIFSRDARTKYNLEKLWADADDIDITGLLS